MLTIIILGTIKIVENNVILKIDPLQKNSSFIFFPGHTWFGGDGGKVTIVYPEQQERYEKRFKEFCSENDIINSAYKDKKKI